MAKGIYPRVLSIAGTDPTGGAGIQADLKSISAAGGYGMSVVTALVAQNTQGVRSVHVPPVDFLQEQLDSVIDDVEIDAVKIGMLADAAITAKVAAFLRRLPADVPVVLDPVMVATSGDRLLEEEAEQAVRDLCSQVDLITPNSKELAVLTQTDEASDLEEAIAMAKEWAKAANTAVVVKGGHLDADIADNAVVNPDGSVHRVAASRVDTKNTHGTGCSLSSALATRLGAGDSPAAALTWSTQWAARGHCPCRCASRGQGTRARGPPAPLAASHAGGVYPAPAVLIRQPGRTGERRPTPRSRGRPAHATPVEPSRGSLGGNQGAALYSGLGHGSVGEGCLWLLPRPRCPVPECLLQGVGSPRQPSPRSSTATALG